MLLESRTIFETFTDEQGAPLAGKTILFLLEGIAADDGRIVISQTVRAKTNLSGRLFDPEVYPNGVLPNATSGVSLLCVADGLAKTLVTAVLPDKTRRSFVLIAGAPIRLFDLFEASLTELPVAVSNQINELQTAVFTDAAVFVSRIALNALSGHRAVIVNAGNKFIYADNSTLTLCNVAGITTGAIAANALGRAQASGLMSENSWNWTLGQPIFLSSNGVLTQTAPTLGYLLEIARAVSPTQILIDIKTAILLA